MDKVKKVPGLIYWFQSFYSLVKINFSVVCMTFVDTTDFPYALNFWINQEIGLVVTQEEGHWK